MAHNLAHCDLRYWFYTTKRMGRPRFSQEIQNAYSFSNENGGKSDVINILSVFVQVFEVCVSVFV